MRDRPEPADPLSDVLSLLAIGAAASLRMATGGPWALRFPAYDYVKFIALETGRLLVRVDGAALPQVLEPGDVLVLAGGLPYVAGTDLARAAADGEAHFAQLVETADGVAWGGTADTVAVAGRFTVEPAQRALLAQVLPPVLHVPAASPAAPVLRTLLDLFRREHGAAPGGRLATASLAQLALVQAVRVHGHGGTPWLRALADPRVGEALRLLHAAPARRWTLPDLAREAGMSRTVLALRFREMVGQPPLQYLQHWRMLLARQALATERTPVATLAYRLGYASESAFSAAFKRWSGSAPGQFRDAAELARQAPLPA